MLALLPLSLLVVLGAYEALMALPPEGADLLPAGDSLFPPLWAFFVAALFWPIVITAHELGHALTAWVLGMELGAVVIGHGPVLVRFVLGGVTVRFHAWLLSGRVYLGASTRVRLRARMWLVRLMGPMTNAALLVVALLWQHRLEAFVGSELVDAWCLLNALMLLANLVPAKRVVRGEVIRTDGLALLQIPFMPREELEKVLITGLTLRAGERFERNDFAGTKHWLLRALERAPGHETVTMFLAVCHSCTGEPDRSVALLTPLLPGAASRAARQRALLFNELAFALLMAHGGSEQSLEVADRLSATAFEMFPCVVEFRSNRALVLCAKQCAAEALGLLGYVTVPTRHRCRGAKWHAPWH